MKSSNRQTDGVLVYLGLLLLAAILASSCATDDAPILTSTPRGTNTVVKTTDIDRFQPGEEIQVMITGITEQQPPHVETIKDDGTITMPSIGPIVAEGKTPGELQREIFNLYVPRLYTSNLTVTVSAADRFIYMGGEVKGAGRLKYSGDMTVTKAVQAAGDFTIFANQRNVRVTRPDGTIFTVDCIKALEDPTYDKAVFPGDKIYVKRRLF